MDTPRLRSLMYDILPKNGVVCSADGRFRALILVGIFSSNFLEIGGQFACIDTKLVLVVCIFVRIPSPQMRTLNTLAADHLSELINGLLIDDMFVAEIWSGTSPAFTFLFRTNRSDRRTCTSWILL
jgi:hypothetical protein